MVCLFLLLVLCSIYEFGSDDVFLMHILFLSLLGPCKFHGGETEALRRLDEKISAENKAFVLKFEKPSTSPNSIEVCFCFVD